MDCYRNFAEIYDGLINEDVDYKSFADSILSICSEKNIKMDNYLDLACGTGNLTGELIKYFKISYGVDLSEEMLMIAKDKLRGNGYNIELICQDITELSLNKKFNLITCALDGVNYLTKDEDIHNFFSRVHNHLQDDGIFIFDINSYYKISEVLGNNIYTYDNDDVFYTWENALYDDIVTMYLTFFIKKEDGTYERFDEEHEERAYTEEEIEEALLRNNLKVLKKLDNYNHGEIKNETERIVFVVGKR